MTMGRAAIFGLVFSLGMSVEPVAAHAQSPMASAPQIQATQTFLMTWGGQKWDEMKAVTADKVTVKVGPGVYTLEPAAQKSDVQLTLPFRGLSTVRTDGKITGVKVDDVAFKVGDKEMHGSATIDLTEDNGTFRVTGVTAAMPVGATTRQ
jgi:hypothetical protein